ncbi:MAG: restriction endonuclease subunit S [Pseudanabaena sp.]|jgi:type I restriction enzyme S subunit
MSSDFSILSDNDDLPMGWVSSTVGDIGIIMSGQTPNDISSFSTENGEIPWFRVGNMNDIGNEIFLIKSDVNLDKVSAHKLGLHIRPAETIIFPKRGGAIATNKKRILGQPSTYDLNTMGILPIEISKKYFWYWFQSIDLNQLSNGSNVPQINHGDIEKLEIPLPPLNEQRRIVEKVEALMARSRRAKEALDAIPKLIEQFRQSVLAAAFRGDLTADWREQNPNIEPASVLLEKISRCLNLEIEKIIDTQKYFPESWRLAKLGACIKKIQAGKNFTCPEMPVSDNTIGLVKISAVTWGKFNPQETKTVDDPQKVDPKLFINKGDFLISRANTLELVGASVIVEEISHKIMLSDKIWRIEFAEIDKRYVNWYLKSSLGRSEIESRATGNQLSMRNISQDSFKEILIPVPPISEQIKIVSLIDSQFDLLERLKDQYQSILKNFSTLDQSILSKAFRGELVEQDPNDEPASVLLERIQQEREKEKTKVKQTGAKKLKK